MEKKLVSFASLARGVYFGNLAKILLTRKHGEVRVFGLTVYLENQQFYVRSYSYRPGNQWLLLSRKARPRTPGEVSVFGLTVYLGNQAKFVLTWKPRLRKPGKVIPDPETAVNIDPETWRS